VRHLLDPPPPKKKEEKKIQTMLKSIVFGVDGSTLFKDSKGF